MNVLHLGTHEPALVEAIVLANGFRLIDMEDRRSWEEWGERQWVGEPEHLLIAPPESSPLADDDLQVGDADYIALIGDIMHGAPTALKPMTFENQRGALACITPWEDWSEPTFDLKDTRAWHWLGNHTTDHETWWTDHRWIDYLNERGI